MIKKKAYEKQDMKTLYNNQWELVKKQKNFSNYGIENEYWFSDKRLYAKLQARNIIKYSKLNFSEGISGINGRIIRQMQEWEYLICWTRSTVWLATYVEIYLDGQLLLHDESHSFCIPISVGKWWWTLDIDPDNVAWMTYNIIFISL